jgi:hypothetical protein
MRAYDTLSTVHVATLDVASGNLYTAVRHYSHMRNWHYRGRRAGPCLTRKAPDHTVKIISNCIVEFPARTYDAARDPHDENIKDSKRSLHRCRKEPALIEIQPEKSAESVCNRQPAVYTDEKENETYR